MSDKDLGKALLKLDLTPPEAAAHVQVDRIVEEDRRRMQWLTRLAVALWILAAAGVLSIAIGSGFVFPAIAKALNERAENEAGEVHFLMLTKLAAACILLGSLSFVVLVAAGLATVVLVYRSRRATLRQINANLLQISEQLKALAGGAPSPGH
ncbi:MAG TPA: hypothetical protein VG826_31140 [Pirellulales bacterium]|nr:hypothetical protein [Pirellulales bacterium]